MACEPGVSSTLIETTACEHSRRSHDGSPRHGPHQRRHAPLTFGYGPATVQPSAGREVWLSLTARITGVTWSEILSGVLLLIFGWRALTPNRPVSLWICCRVPDGLHGQPGALADHALDGAVFRDSGHPLGPDPYHPGYLTAGGGLGLVHAMLARGGDHAPDDPLRS